MAVLGGIEIEVAVLYVQNTATICAFSFFDENLSIFLSPTVNLILWDKRKWVQFKFYFVSKYYATWLQQ